jgi:hypothetical protein
MEETPKHLLIVLANSEPGRDAEFNTWYSGRHLDDVLKLDGIVAAQRFELSETPRPQKSPYRYLAVYEVPAEKLEDAVSALRAAQRQPELMPVSDSMASDFKAWWYTSITDRVSAPEDPNSHDA